MQKSVTFKKAGISFSDVGKGTAVVLLHGFLENKHVERRDSATFEKKSSHCY